MSSLAAFGTVLLFVRSLSGACHHPAAFFHGLYVAALTIAEISIAGAIAPACPQVSMTSRMRRTFPKDLAHRHRVLALSLFVLFFGELLRDPLSTLIQRAYDALSPVHWVNVNMLAPERQIFR
jgi:hypothetical protein